MIWVAAGALCLGLGLLGWLGWLLVSAGASEGQLSESEEEMRYGRGAVGNTKDDEEAR